MRFYLLPKQFNLTNIMERFGWRAGKPAFQARLSFGLNLIIPSPRMRFYLFPKQFKQSNLMERFGWWYQNACGSYCLVSAPRIGGIKQKGEPLSIATLKKTLREVLGGVEPSFKKVPQAILSKII